MIRRFLFVAAFMFFSQTVFAQGHPATETSAVSSKINLLDHWIRNQMEFRGIPGLAIGVVYDQQLVWSKGYGYADVGKQTPMSPTTLFRMASITKLFTSTAIMQLRDTGKLQLDDPVKKHLSWFNYKNRHKEGPVVTIRHLLTHTSGLPRESDFPYWTDRTFPTREELIKTFQTQESIFEPETRYKYSNLGIAVLGEIVAAVSGQPYEEFVQKNIFNPLGMANSSVFLSDADKSKLAVGYGRRMADGKRALSDFTDSKAIAPAANITSTIEDMTKFASLQFRTGQAGGNQILKGSTLREMQRVQWVNSSWTGGRGLGFLVSRSDGKEIVGHGGWVGGYRSQLLVSPSEKVAVIVFTNADDGIPGYFANRALRMLAGPLMTRLKPPSAPRPEPDPTWSMYVGRYTDPSGWESEVMLHEDELVLYDYSYPPEDDPSGGLVTLTPEGKHTFRMTGENGNGEMVVFEMDEHNMVKRVKTGANFIFPVKVTK